jgi:hypothetical protein
MCPRPILRSVAVCKHVGSSRFAGGVIQQLIRTSRIVTNEFLSRFKVALGVTQKFERFITVGLDHLETTGPHQIFNGWFVARHSQGVFQ